MVNHTNTSTTCMGLPISRDWTYLAEGGKNVVFCYTGEEDTVWRNKVLRVAKSDLAICDDSIYCTESIINDTTNKRREDHDSGDSESDKRCIIRGELFTPENGVPSWSINFFVQHVVRPSLGEPYVDLSQPVTLSCAFAARLYRDTIMTKNCIPPHRLHSWQTPPSFQKNNRGDTCTTPFTISAFLLTNHASSSAPSVSGGKKGKYEDEHGVVCSVEVKPKGANVTRSPLVHALHRIKLVPPPNNNQCRFTQLQTRKEERRRSGYNPQQLFSLHLPHMQESCHQLFRRPQNNLQVWYHGKPLLPSHNNTLSTTAPATTTATTSTSTTTQQSWSRIWTDLVMEDEIDHTIIQTSDETNTSEKAQTFVLQHLVPQILKQEGTLLQNILHLQQLDVVDADGAILIYHHLVQTHCRGSMDDADQLIDDYVPCDDSSTILRIQTEHDVTSEHQEQQQLSPSQCLNRYSPFSKPVGEDLDDFLQELDRFASHQLPSIMTMEYNNRQEELDASLQSATHLVNRLSLDACIYLLRNWLLSLAMCDISLFCSISKNTTPFSGSDHSNSNGRITGAPTIMAQTTDRSGYLQIPLPDDHPDEKKDPTSCCNMERMVSCRYTVKVVDCDAKPAHKLRSRHEKELIFRTIICE